LKIGASMTRHAAAYATTTAGTANRRQRTVTGRCNYIGVVDRRRTLRQLALAGTTFLFGLSVSYGILTIVFTLLVVALVVTARTGGDESRAADRSPTAVSALFGAAAAIVVALAAYRWTKLAASLPYHADMLIVIREATRRFLSGRNPYTTYRAYDAPWDMAMPYGPALWGPFVAAQWLRLDFRLLTIAGELIVPAWCGIAAAVDASRGRIASATSLLAVAGALVATLDVQRFTLIGHTPIYWPLFLLLALTIARGRWIAAACVLGMLVAARTTMATMVPVFLMAAFIADRRRFPAIATALMVTIAVILAPFAIWDPRAVWDSMVLSYPRVMKAAVWPVLARPGLETIGVTEWLLERGRDSLVVPAQIIAMLFAYGAAWIAIRRNRPPLPWMVLALFAFSLTTLYPVHYLYYDVLLLLVADALTSTIDSGVAPRIVRPWILSLTAVAALVFITIRVVAPPFPHVAAGDVSSDGELRSGFAGVEHDGARAFSWIVGREARIVLSRSSAEEADIVLTGESALDRDQPPQRMIAILNGVVLSETTIPAGPRNIRLTAPRTAWWIGFNELHLVLSSTLVPRDAGRGGDSRPLALAIGRVDVVRRKN
jgi:hypothetical protein